MTARIIQFPRPPLDASKAPLRGPDAEPVTRCDDPVHVFASRDQRCQCGENLWPDDEGGES